MVAMMSSPEMAQSLYALYGDAFGIRQIGRQSAKLSQPLIASKLPVGVTIYEAVVIDRDCYCEGAQGL